MESIDTSTATGRMFIKIVGIFAEFERENLAERVSFGFEQKAKEGNFLGTNVYGFDYVKGTGDMNVNPEQAKIVCKIYEMYLQGNSTSKICKWLTENGVATKKGGRWNESTILSILTNPLYIGKVRYGLYNQKPAFTIDSARYEHILEEETFDRVQAMLENRKTYKKHPGTNTYFLSFLTCAECGKRLSTNQHRDPKTGKLYVNYYCRGKKAGECSCRGFSQEKMEQAFQDFFANYADMPVQQEVLEPEDAVPQENRQMALGKELAQLEQRLAHIRGMFAQDKISFEEYRSFVASLDAKEKLLSDELATLAPTDEKITIDPEAVKKLVGNLRANWANLTNEEKKQFLSMFVDRIMVYSQKGIVLVQEIKPNNGKAKEPLAKKTKKFTRKVPVGQPTEFA